MAVDDQEVEAWYLEGWCFFLMAEQSKETGEKLEDLSWQELAKDARDCLEACLNVSSPIVGCIMIFAEDSSIVAACRPGAS